jgi:cytochrome c oxidase subunit I+III
LEPGKQRASRFEETWHGPRGILAALTVVNNQPVGKRFILTAFSFFLIGGLMAIMMRIQLAVSNNTFMSPELYNQMFTMHGSVMMFLFVVPFLEGLAVFLLPLMIGARDLAFPRLAAFSYFTFLFGGLMFFLSFAYGAVPDAGWFAYVPLSGPRYSGLGMDFWLLGLSMVEIAGITAGIEIVVTVLKFRAPGMSINRMPVFAWAMLVVGVMIIVAFTTLLMATVLLELDRAVGTHFFQPERGGSTLLWQHLFWFFGHPEVYIAFIPATGIVSMIIPIAARRALSAYTLVVVALIITGFLSFGLWVHHMYTTGLPTLSMNFFAAASLMIALATGTQIFAWIATLWGSRPRFTVPFLYILGFFFIFTLGGMTGVMVAVVPFDWQVHDTFFVVAHFHYVLIGGVVFPILAGLYHWFPKIAGRMPHGLSGHIAFWLAFIGFNIAFFPMHIMGFLGMPRRVYTYIPELGLDTLNMISTVGAFMFAAGIVLQVANYIFSAIWGKKAPDNPWGGDSLEWSISSPPPIYAFHTPPLVRGRHTLWTQSDTPEPPETARIRRALAGAPEEFRATLVTDAIDAEPQAIQPLPGPTYIPFIAAIGLLITAYAILLNLYITAAAGLVVFVGAVVAWFAPREDLLELLRNSRAAREAGLPIFTTGSRSPAWWGLISLLACCGTGFMVMFYSYFYIRLFSEDWPQNDLPLPEFLLPAPAFGALVVSAGLHFMARRAFLRGQKRTTQFWLLPALLLAACFLGVHFFTTLRLDFTPRTNAYASLFHITSWFLWLQVIVGIGINIALQVRLAGEKEEHLHRDILPLRIQIAAHYWYFTAAAGIAVFAVLYISPYII